MAILIGLIKLEFPFVRPRKNPDAPIEKIHTVAFDESGDAWGLVTRLTPLGEGLGRVDFVRWVPFTAIPFAGPEETVGPNGWEPYLEPPTRR